MIITPAIKGQLTKAMKSQTLGTNGDALAIFGAVRLVFARHMPREQAKHATRKYLRSNLA